MRKNKFIIITFLLIWKSALSQTNLVPNPSFEILTGCDSMQIYYGNAPPWDCPNTGSPDLFNTCGVISSVNIPSNFAGFQYPLTGNGYVGLDFYQLGGNSFREYIQVRLDSTLVSQHKYCVTFYVSLCKGLASNNIGVYFSTTHTFVSGSNRLNLTPQILDINIISDTINWTPISGEYISSGGERYIIIGNFNTAVTTSAFSVSGGIDSYYFIDDVSIVDCTGSGLGLHDLEDSNKFILSPNPNNGQMQFNYSLKNNETAVLKLYDILGKEIREYKLLQGNTTLTINEENLNSGIYFYKLILNQSLIKSDKLVIVK